MVNAIIEKERFDGKGDFSLWKKRLLAHMYVLDLKDVSEESMSPVVSGIQKNEDKDYRERLVKEEAERLERSSKALNIIILSVRSCLKEDRVVYFSGFFMVYTGEVIFFPGLYRI